MSRPPHGDGRGNRAGDGLTIAVPKGALYPDAVARLRAAGVDVPDDVGRRLTVTTNDGTTLLFLRPTDVPAYVEFGSADCGIVGKDVLWETDRNVAELADLGFGYCRLVVAARERAAGNVVRYAGSQLGDEALLDEARAHGIPRVVIAVDGTVRELRVGPRVEGLPVPRTPSNWDAR